MSNSISLGQIYLPSADVVARVIDGELILVPLAAGVGDAEDALFTLNETGQAIWNLLDGKRSLRDIAGQLAAGFEAAPGEIEEDITGLMSELLSRRMVTLKSPC